MSFETAFAVVVGIEGGYVNDPHDPGGETKFGISKRAYPQLDIASLTLEQAHAIYLRDYWHLCKCDELAPDFALVVFDCAVNQGAGTALKLRALSSNLVDFQAERALRYAQNANFDRYGRGWFRRLFNITVQASK